MSKTKKKGATAMPAHDDTTLQSPSYKTVTVTAGPDGGYTIWNTATNSGCNVVFDEIDTGMGNYAMTFISHDRSNPTFNTMRYYFGSDTCGLEINRYGDGISRLNGKWKASSLELPNKPSITTPTDLASALVVINKLTAYLGLN